MQNARIDDGCFVSDELFASFVVFWEFGLHEGLEGVVVTQVDRVPELGLTMVQIVDAIKVEVLLVPAKHRLPLANIHVWVSDALDFHITHSFPQNRIKLGEVPWNTFVEKRAGHVSSVQRRIIDETAPELNVNK